MQSIFQATAPEQIYQDNIKLAEFFVRKYFPNNKPGSFLYDELAGEARVALWRAAKEYKPELSKFSTFAGVCILKALFKYYSRVYKKQCIVFDSLFDSSIVDSWESDLDTELIALRSIEKAEAKKAVKEGYPILDMYFFQGLTQDAISKQIGKSQAIVSRIINKDLDKLKRKLGMA